VKIFFQAPQCYGNTIISYRVGRPAQASVHVSCMHLYFVFVLHPFAFIFILFILLFVHYISVNKVVYKIYRRLTVAGGVVVGDVECS